MYKRILTAVTAIVLLCLPTAWAADTSATAAILMDGDTGEVLYEKNPDRQMLIASTTKLMTTLVVLERGGLGDVVTVTQQHIAEGSSMYLKPGDRVTVEELLYGLLLCSGNDAALALADHCGGLERFVAEMNRKAAELGDRYLLCKSQRFGSGGPLFHGTGYGPSGGLRRKKRNTCAAVLHPQRYGGRPHHDQS